VAIQPENRKYFQNILMHLNHTLLANVTYTTYCTSAKINETLLSVAFQGRVGRKPGSGHGYSQQQLLRGRHDLLEGFLRSEQIEG
jgi:hypothetical protein